MWSGGAVRTDCRYALQLWAYGPDGPTAAIKNVRANHRCTPAESKTQIAGWPSPRAYDVRGATSIVQRVVCMGDRGEPYCSSRARNYLRTFTAQALVADVTPPAVKIVPNNAFTRGAWVSGVQSVAYGASDNVGVKVARALAAEAFRKASTPRDAIIPSESRAKTALGSHPVNTSGLQKAPNPFSPGLDAAENSGKSRASNGARSTTPLRGPYRSGSRGASGGETRTTSTHLGQPQRR